VKSHHRGKENQKTELGGEVSETIQRFAEGKAHKKGQGKKIAKQDGERNG